MNETTALLPGLKPEPPTSCGNDSLKDIVYKNLRANALRCLRHVDSPFPVYEGQLIKCIDDVLARSRKEVAVSRNDDAVRAAVGSFLLGTLQNPGKGTRIAVIHAVLNEVVPAEGRNVFPVYQKRAIGVGMCVLVEGMHNLSLIVDDCIDRDLVRRGKPTLYSSFGTNGVEEAAHILAESLFRTIDGLPIHEESKDFISAKLVDTARLVANAIISEIAWDTKGNGIPWEAIDPATIEDIYLCKTSAIVNMVIDSISHLFELDAGATTQIRRLISRLGLFLQSVNDLENFSNIKEGCPNVDQFGDIRRRRITPFSLRSGAGKVSQLSNLREKAYAPNAEPLIITAYVEALQASGAIHDEIARLTQEKAAIHDAILLTDLSKATKHQITIILDKYARPLESVGVFNEFAYPK